MVTVCTLLEGWYEAAECRGHQAMESPLFAGFQATAETILRG